MNLADVIRDAQAERSTLLSEDAQRKALDEQIRRAYRNTFVGRVEFVWRGELCTALLNELRKADCQVLPVHSGVNDNGETRLVGYIVTLP